MSIVLGEAPETDSEDEIVIPNSYKKISSSNHSTPAKSSAKDLILKGSIVNGETESDTDANDLLSTPLGTELTEDYNPSEQSSPISEDYRKFLNEMSHQIFNEFIQSSTQRASKQLLETDQTLIKSQITLQNASITIKNFKTRLNTIETKMKNMIDDNFIPNINL